MNLKSLAILLGMSKTTVSRALNGYPEVNGVTRARVLAAAKETGYQANPMARGLAVGRSNSIGVIQPLLSAELADPMQAAVVGGMTEALEAAKMQLFIAPVSPLKELAAYETMVRARRVDGLVVSRTLVDDERINYLSQAGFPFIAHGRCGLETPYAWFDYDNEAGIEQALVRLLGLGHQRIAYLGGPGHYHFARQRRDAFVRSMTAAGLSCDPRYSIETTLDRRAGQLAMQQLLECAPRPTAVIVDNHLAGAGALRALLDAGVVLGKEMSLIVWGGVDEAPIGVTVSSIDEPELHSAGATMMYMLLALLNGTPPAELQVLWQPVLLAGATVGPCPE